VTKTDSLLPSVIGAYSQLFARMHAVSSLDSH